MVNFVLSSDARALAMGDLTEDRHGPTSTRSHWWQGHVKKGMAYIDTVTVAFIELTAAWYAANSAFN